MSLPFSIQPLQNPSLHSSTTAVAVAVKLLPLTLDPFHCMGKKKSSSKSKEVLVDEEVSLSIIENQNSSL
jgi:hypothetical protein